MNDRAAEGRVADGRTAEGRAVDGRVVDDPIANNQGVARAEGQRDDILPNGNILRYEFRERLMHWINGFAYLYLMFTGLGIWSPWLMWILVVLGGAQLSRLLHPWVGLVFSLSLTWMFFSWASEMHTTAEDKEWMGAINHYVRNEDEEMPAAGRYNAGQKSLFWGFVFCGVLLLLSGLVLWLPEYIPWNARAFRYAAVLIHPSAALLTIGLFLIHIYMSVFAERGALQSMTRGDVTQNFAKRHHRLWWERVIGSYNRR